MPHPHSPRTRRAVALVITALVSSAALIVATMANGSTATLAAVAPGERAPAVHAERAAGQPVMSSPAPARPAKVPNAVPPGAVKGLKALVKQTKTFNRTSRALVKPGKQAQLARLARLSVAARTKVRKATCGSVRALASYRTALATVKLRPKPKKPVARALGKLAGLGAQSTKVTLLLLGTTKTKACGGGVAPSKRDQTKTTVKQSTDGHLTLQVSLPKVVLAPATGGGTSFVKLLSPDTTAPGLPGQPSIPTASGLFGVPDGADVSVKISGVQTMTLQGVQLYPSQPDPADTAQPDFTKAPFGGLPFVPEKPLSGVFPAKPAQAAVIGSSRGVQIGRVDVSTAQYSPKSDTLKVLTALTVDIRFAGGSGAFSSDLCSPFELSAARLVGGLANAATIYRGCQYPVLRCGEELLVITNTSTLDQATTYAAARRNDGFLTKVVTTNGEGGIGSTNTAIQTYIRQQLASTTCIKPSYVTLMGDDKLVPTFQGPYQDPSKPEKGRIPSDNAYSMADNADELPDLAVGRILGNDATEVGRFVAKINHYQSTPPTGGMLNRATIAAYFQDSDPSEGNPDPPDGQEARTFIRFSEDLRTGLRRRLVDVDRIYKTEATVSPKKLDDGTSLPASLRKPTFAWDGDAADISAAWNQGRFLMVHRDHGWSDGWGDPDFETADVNALTNDNDHLPVLMSINCASASYDNDDTSFVQTALVKETGGAVAAFGDTRNSPSTHNSVFALGVADGLLPWVLTGEGPAYQQRLGDALTTGKLRLASTYAPSTATSSTGDYNTRKELFLWHLFGDPTMKMFGGTKQFFFDPSKFVVAYTRLPDPDPTAPGFGVNVTLPANVGPGQPVSLLGRDAQTGQEYVIGKAVTTGSTTMTIAAQTSDADSVDRNSLRIVLNADNALPVSVDESSSSSTTRPVP